MFLLHIDFSPLTGKLRYANNSNYKNDVMIRKEVMSLLRDFLIHYSLAFCHFLFFLGVVMKDKEEESINMSVDSF